MTGRFQTVMNTLYSGLNWKKKKQSLENYVQNTMSMARYNSLFFFIIKNDKILFFMNKNTKGKFL